MAATALIAALVALEQRGAQLKRIGSCVASFRPRRKDVGHWRAWGAGVCARLGTSPWRVDVAANTGADPDGYAEECYLLGLALVMYTPHHKDSGLWGV